LDRDGLSSKYVLSCKTQITSEFYKSTVLALQQILQHQAASEGDGLAYPFDCYRTCYANLLEVQRRLIEPLRHLKSKETFVQTGEFMLFRSKCPKYFIDREGRFQHTLADVSDSSVDNLIFEVYKEVSEWVLQKSIPISRIACKLWITNFNLRTRDMDDKMENQPGSKDFFQIICNLASGEASPQVSRVNTFKTPMFSLLACLKHFELSFSQAFDHLGNSYDQTLVGYKILVEHLKTLSLDQLFFRKTNTDPNAAVGIYSRIYSNFRQASTGPTWPNDFLGNIKSKYPGLQYEDLELYLVSQFSQPSTHERLVQIQKDLDLQMRELNVLQDKAVVAVRELNRVFSSPAIDDAERFCKDLQVASVLDRIEPELLGDRTVTLWFGQQELFSAAVFGAKRQGEVYSVRHVDVPRDSKTVFWKKKAAYSGTPADGILYCLRMVCISQTNASKRMVCSYRSLPQIHSFVTSLDDPSLLVILNKIQVADLTGGKNWYRSEFIEDAQGIIYALFGEIMKKICSVELDGSAKEILRLKLSDFLVHESQDDSIASLSDASSPLILKSKTSVPGLDAASRGISPAFVPGVWLLAHDILSQVLKGHMLLLEGVLPVPGSPALKEFSKIHENVKKLSLKAAGTSEALGSLEAYELRARRLRLAQNAVDNCPELSLLKQICDKGHSISKTFQASCVKAVQVKYKQSGEQTMSPNHMAQIAMVCQLLEHKMQEEYKRVVNEVTLAASRFENALKEKPTLASDCPDVSVNEGIFSLVWVPEFDKLFPMYVRDWDDDRQSFRDKVRQRILRQDMEEIKDLIKGVEELTSVLTQQ
jgi:hypothetical protein